MARITIYWAIGSPDGPRSSAWFLSGNKKGDIYVAVRSLGGTIKASFHKDGRCQIGFTEQYAPTAIRRFASPSRRHWETWQLPADPVVRILQVCVPHSELRLFVDRNPHNVTWLPPPSAGSIAEVSIFVTAPGIRLSFADDARNTIVVGKVSTSIRTAWLAYVHRPIDAAMAKVINDEREKLLGKLGTGKPRPNTRAAACGARDHELQSLELACDSPS